MGRADDRSATGDPAQRALFEHWRIARHAMSIRCGDKMCSVPLLRPESPCWYRRTTKSCRSAEQCSWPCPIRTSKWWWSTTAHRMERVRSGQGVRSASRTPIYQRLIRPAEVRESTSPTAAGQSGPGRQVQRRKRPNSLNAGLNVAAGDLVCAIDADTLVGPQALHQLVAPFLTTATRVAVGGTPPDQRQQGACFELSPTWWCPGRWWRRSR